MVGRQLTTSSPTKPHKWSWSAIAGIIEMLLERRFQQRDDTSPSLNMTKASHMLRAMPLFVCIRELITAGASYSVRADG